VFGLVEGVTAVKGLTVGKMSADVADPVVTPGVTVGVGVSAVLDIVGVSDGVTIACAGRSGAPVPAQALIRIRATEAKAVRLVTRIIG
jgi:hypothetical protein